VDYNLKNAGEERDGPVESGPGLFLAEGVPVHINANDKRAGRQHPPAAAEN